MKIHVFRNVLPCDSQNSYCYFKGTLCLHLQSHAVQQERTLSLLDLEDEGTTILKHINHCQLTRYNIPKTSIFKHKTHHSELYENKQIITVGLLIHLGITTETH